MDVTVVVRWMDGTQETYRCYVARVEDRVLYLTQRLHSGQPKRCIPLDSVRIWTQEGD